MANQAAAAPARRRGGVRSTGRARQRAARAGGRQEQVSLVQFLLCLALFLAVFIGKGAFPEKMVQVRENILSLISSNTDFRAAFSQLGASMSGQGTVLEELGQFCVEVFGGGGTVQEEPDALASGPLPQPADSLSEELRFLGGKPDQYSLMGRYLGAEGQAALPSLVQPPPPVEKQEEEPPQKEMPEGAAAAVPAAGTLLLKADYSGKELPKNCTMDQLSLGVLETMSPILGKLNSGYGYRDHPISGKHHFHQGVDIGGQSGDPISAFAAGTVEYIGEDDSYGLYMQMDHGNGVKSFYAHCKSICVSKGQPVALGEKIGEVGSSGSATGPHLHLELKYNKMRLDPAYYVEFLTEG